MKRCIFFALAISSGFTQAAAPVHDLMGQIQRAIAFIQEYNRIRKETEAAGRLLKNLANLKFDNLGDLTNRFSQFKYRIRSIGYTYEGIANQLKFIYKKDGPMLKKMAVWRDQSDDSIEDAMVSQGLAGKSEDHINELNKVVEIKRTSSSNADTLQAIGEINAIQSKQLADMSQIIATDARVKSSVLMEERAKEKERREIEARLLHDFDEHKKSRPLAHFPSLGSTAPRL